MIEYDYQLKKRFGSEVKTFTPVFKTNIKNIAKLRGPTGSGKSTLMTLVALSCHGLDEDTNILDGLKQDMRDIYDDDDSEFKFSMKISGDKGYQLRLESQKVGDLFSEKKNKFIKIFETVGGGKETPIGKDTFIRRYRLLYDMPDDPMKRIGILIEKIASTQKRFTADVSDLNKTAGLILQKINSTSKQSDIEQKEKRLAEIEEDINKINAERKTKNLIVAKLKKYNASLLLRKAESEYNIAYNAFVRLESAKKDKNKKDKMAAKKYKDGLWRIETHKRKICTDFIRIHGILSEFKFIDKIDLDSWESQRPRQDQELTLQTIDKISDFVRRIGNSVSREMESQNTKKEEELYDLIRELVRCLEKHKSIDMKVMGQTVDELSNRLNHELKTTEDKVQYTKKLKSLDDEISSLKTSLKNLNESIIALPSEPDIDINQDNSEEIENNCSIKESALDAAILEAEKHNITLENYQELIGVSESDSSLYEYTTDPQKLQDIIKILDHKLGDLKKQVEGENGLNEKRAIVKNKIEEMKQEKSHELSEYYDELRKIENRSSKMISDLAKKDSLLKKLVAGVAREEDLKDDADFYNLVCKNLALAIGAVKSGGSMHPISQIDIVNKKIIVSNGMEIPFKHLSSGESQNMHLRGQLNNDDGRCIIALFDEVGLMDTETLGNVLEIITELYESGNLLVGWMAMPGDSSEVEEYG